MLSVWIFTITLLIGISLSQVTLNYRNCTLPRVRYRWGSLTSSEQQNYLNAVLLLKNYQEIPYPGATYKMSLYDIFCKTHSSQLDAAFAHGSSGFYPWHRHFMWTYETALQEVVTIYNSQLLSSGATSGFLDACVTVPYWDWENDYQKESSSIVWSADTFGEYQENSCVVTGKFTNWAGADGYCLWRTLDVQQYGGISCGEAQIIDYLVGSESYSTYCSNIQISPHGSLHVWIGGEIGAMANMWSPDDPLFYVHHANIDRFWTLWQDCYNYDKLSQNSLPQNVFPSSWSNPDDPSTVYTSTQNMPYTVDLDGGTYPSYRFPAATRAIDMHSIGYGGSTGFMGMYYRYGPDEIVTTLNANRRYSKICHFDGWVNYVPPTKKRSLEDLSFNGPAFTVPSSDVFHKKNDTDKKSKFAPAPSPAFHKKNGTVKMFKSANLQAVIEEIEKKYGNHTPHQKLHYVALYECSSANKPKDRNYTIPLEWCLMNHIDPDNYKTICEKEGQLDGYEPVAQAVQQQLLSANSNSNDQNQNQPTWILPVSITAAALLLIGIVIGTVFFIKKREAEHF